MAQNFDFDDKINFPADVVFKKMMDPKFVEEWAVVQGSLNPKAKVIKSDEKEIILELNQEEPLPIGTKKSMMRFKWDVPKMKGTWERMGEGMGSKAKVYGTSEVIADGDNACHLVDKGTMDVGIPLVGKKLEQGVIEHLRKNRARKIEFFVKALEADSRK